MAIMKQIQDCLDRAFVENKKPLPSKKWKALIVEDKKYGKILYLFHYHHQVLVYLIDRHFYAEEWWEKQADKRGLLSSKEYLDERWKKENKISV